MRQNYSSQTTTYGGALIYNPTVSFPLTITIPLFITTIDIPVRKPKLTEINTIPTHDENSFSDWSTSVVFYGGQGLLVSTFSGFFITPITQQPDGITGKKYSVFVPTTGNFSTDTLLGYTYGEIIWAYLEGKLNQPNTNVFVRTDPSTYRDPFGNSYSNPIIQQFESEQTSSTEKQTFTMSLYLEV